MSSHARTRLVLLTLAGLPLVAILAVLGVVLAIALRDTASGAWTLQNFRTLYTSAFAQRALLNTAAFAGISVAVACCLALPVAWAAERTTLPGRRLLSVMMTLGIVIPPFFIAMGWLVLLQERVGIINVWLRSVLPFRPPPIDVTTVWGMGFVSGLSLAPLAFVMIAASFRTIDPALEEAARVHGMRVASRLTRILAPLAWPAILGAGLYIFIIGLSSFDIPAVIGLGSRTFTFSTFVWSTAFSTNAQPDYGIIAASSALTLIVGLALSLYYLSIIRRSHRYAVIGGKGYRHGAVTLTPSAVVGWWAFIGSLLLLEIVLPFLALLWVALTPFVEQPTGAALARASLANFRNIPWTAFLEALRATAILTVAVPTITALFGLAISWVVVRSGLRLAAFADVIAFLPHAVPTLIFAIGTLFLSLFVLPSPISPYGSIQILIFAFVVIRISFATRMYNSAILQINRELDEAGYVCGMDSLRVLRRILLPILRPTLLASWLWMAVLASRELTAAVVLTTSAHNVTAPVLIWNLWQGGEVNQAAAMCLAFLAIMAPLIILFFWAGEREPAEALG